MLERAREGDGVDGKREEDNSSLGLGLIASFAWVFLRNVPNPDVVDRRATTLITRESGWEEYHEGRGLGYHEDRLGSNAECELGVEQDGNVTAPASVAASWVGASQVANSLSTLTLEFTPSNSRVRRELSARREPIRSLHF